MNEFKELKDDYKYEILLRIRDKSGQVISEQRAKARKNELETEIDALNGEAVRRLE